MGIMGNRAIWEAESDGLELLNITIGDLVDQQAAALSDKEALVYHYPERGLDVHITFRVHRTHGKSVRLMPPFQTRASSALTSISV